MKVFISHKNSDSGQATLICNRLQSLGVEAYLDLLDPTVLNDGRQLTRHIEEQLRICTDIMIIVSEATKSSWWVPFEIGMSAELNMPTASFVSTPTKLPSFLSYWPKLRNLNDINTYVEVRRQVSREMRLDQYSIPYRRSIETPVFYQKLKSRL